MTANPPDFSSWNLSQSAIELLRREPEIASDLARERKRLPFPAGYRPAVIDILYDDLLYVRSEYGQITFLRDCPRNYIPPFMEIRFDDQMAMFVIRGEMVVDRTQNMAALDELLGRLNP
ncbi:MAG: hypothetical protein WBA10_10495 [Elainellaceae cyanobacterium]